MLGKIYLVLIPLILIPFGLIAMSYNDVDEVVQAQEDIKQKALKKIDEFTNGESIEWDKIPMPPMQEFIWVERIVPIQSVDADGNIITVNQTVKEQVPTVESEIFAELRDRQTGSDLVCKMGHQCDITGRINLYEPTSGLRLQPVIFHYQFFCKVSKDPVKVCDNFIGDSQTILSYPDSTFKVTWVPSDKGGAMAGIYDLFIRATSKYKDPFGQPIERESKLEIEVIP